MPKSSLQLLLSITLLVGCSRSEAATAACPGNDAGLSLPSGFCATIFADSIGHGRHLVVAPNGTVYVNTWGGRFYQTPPHAGGFLVALRDTNNDGRADVIARFGGTPDKQGAGGTGIAIYKNYLYAEEGPTVVRYALSANNVAAVSSPEVVITGLPLTGDHPMHPFVIDSNGNLFMDSGSETNSCQLQNRARQSPGHEPCTELATRGGIWRFDANKLNQPFSPANRYATGIRNAVGIAIGPDGSLYSTQHGRDQLGENWPALYSSE